ncbi:hypothetical protein ASD58_06835 [Duganella sp. Root1480D1]|nr:hypothetical protein ASD58_06835 [Duganella sp. Root1480D1]
MARHVFLPYLFLLHRFATAIFLADLLDPICFLACRFRFGYLGRSGGFLLKLLLSRIFLPACLFLPQRLAP